MFPSSSSKFIAVGTYHDCLLHFYAEVESKKSYDHFKSFSKVKLGARLDCLSTEHKFS